MGGGKLSEEKKFKCHLCGQIFNSNEERDKHNQEVHPKAYKLSHLLQGSGEKKHE